MHKPTQSNQAGIDATAQGSKEKHRATYSILLSNVQKLRINRAVGLGDASAQIDQALEVLFAMQNKAVCTWVEAKAKRDGVTPGEAVANILEWYFDRNSKGFQKQKD